MTSLWRFSLLLWSLLWTGLAGACAICAPEDTQKTVVRQLAAAERIVLAQLVHEGKSPSVLTVVRGATPPERLPMAATTDGTPPPSPALAEDLMLLSMNPGDSRWNLLGHLPKARAAWLQRLVSMAPAPLGAEPDLARAQFFAKDLENETPLVARAAYEEVAALPFFVLRALATDMDSRKLAQWLQDTRLAARWPLYYLLYGVSGRAVDATFVERRVLDRSTDCSVSELSAMLAALLALRGEAGLAWVEQHFLSSRITPDAEVQAALLALSVHGTDGVAVSREQVVAGYGRFIARNPQRAGFVASDLANWGRWEFAEAFGLALRSGDGQVFASRYAMVFYLLRNPRPDAKAMVETLRAEKLL